MRCLSAGWGQTADLGGAARGHGQGFVSRPGARRPDPGSSELVRRLRAAARDAAPLFRASTALPAPPRPSARGLALLSDIRREVSRRAGVSPNSPPWRHGQVPSLGPPFLLRIFAPSLGRSRADYLLAPCRPATSFERAGAGAWTPPTGGRSADLDSLSAAFTTDVAPAAQTPHTRRSYDGPWLAFLTFAAAYHAEHATMPARPRLLTAFLSLLVAADLAASTIRRYLHAIKDQHVRRGEPFLLDQGQLGRWNRAISRHTARERPQVVPISAHMVRRLLLLPTTSPRDFQDVLATVLCTVTATRPSDLVNIDVCDLLLQYHNDPPGTAAIRIWGSKPDIARKGHFPRVGRSSDPRLSVVDRLLYWCLSSGLLPSPRCSKAARPRTACTACGTLFRRLDATGAARPSADPSHPWSTSDFTQAVRRAVSRIGYDPAGFEARSCRIGGISTGASALIPEYVIALQSGHASRGSNPSARRYIVLRSQTAVFALWDAFGL